MADEPLARRADDPKIAVMQAHVVSLQLDTATLKTDVAGLKNDVATNTALTKKISEDTGSLLEFWEAAEGAFKVLKWLGWIAKWVTIIAGSFAAVSAAFYAMTHFGQIPVDTPK